MNKANSGKAGNVGGPRLNIKVIANLLRLFDKDAVPVEHAFGWSRTPRGKDDRRFVLPFDIEWGKRVRLRLGETLRRNTTGPPVLANHKIVPAVWKVPAENKSCHLGQGDANDALRFGRRQAPHHVFAAHARVDQDDIRTRLEQREHMRHKFNARWHHQGQPHPLLDTMALEAVGQLVAALFQLGEVDPRVLNGSPLTATSGGNGQAVGHPSRRFGQRMANVLKVVKPPR